MTTDFWNGNGDWNLNPSGWSLLTPPTSSTPAEIQSGTATISTSGVAEWLTIDSGAGFALDDGVTFATTKWLNNAGGWNLGAGDAVTIGGRLTNSGAITIGSTTLVASTTVNATTLVNSGTLYLQGNALSGTTDKASLILSGAAASTLTGTVTVAGDAALQFGSGGITTVGAGATLDLLGSGAQILTDGGASSALSGLTANYGTLYLQGYTGYGAGGATLTTTKAFTNYGTAYVDANPSLSGEGGSAVTFGGTLTNDGTLDIGNASLSASTTVNATTLANNGTLVVWGNVTSGTTDKASLILSGAAASTLTGVVAGDATLQFGSGGITTVGTGGLLQLDGSVAQILTSGGASSALSGLTANDGTLLLEGAAAGLGAGGVTLTTTKAFTNYLNAYVDSYRSGEGGSAVTFGGTLTNDGGLYIGNGALSASTTVNATTLDNSGTLNLVGNESGGTTDKASLNLSGAATSTSTGVLVLGGDATLTTTAFTNYGTADVDVGGDFGGSVVTFGRTLTNDGTLNIGNTGLGASTIVNATTLVNQGALWLQGNASSVTTDKASLILSGAAASSLTGTVTVAGDATLQFGSGGITTVGAGAVLSLAGAGAKVLTGGGASSALSGLTANEGMLYVQGDTGYGAGGATLTTTKAFANYDGTYVDNTYNGDGGSAVTFGGKLTNDGTFDIGNTGLSALTSVKATTLVNNSTLTLQGNASSGTIDKASLVLSGAAASTSTGTLQVSGDATLEFGSGGITTIGAGASLELDGSDAQILTSGGASSALSGLTANDGTLALEGDNGYGAGGATLTTTGAFTNYDNAYVDSYYMGDGGSVATFGGTLTNDGTLDLGNTGLSAASTVTAKGLNNAGTLALAGSGSALAELVVKGSATTTGNITIGADSEVDVTGSHSFTQNGGSTTVTGSLVASTINADDGVLDFASAVTSGDGVGALDIGALGNLQFDSLVDSSHSVNFAAADGTLSLGDAGAFSGTIDNFAASDAIDLLGEPITRLSYSGTSSSGTLTVTGSSGTIATLAFSGDYTTSSFTFASDGHGGSNILHT